MFIFDKSVGSMVKSQINIKLIWEGILMVISSQVLKKKGSETIPQGSRVQVNSKRLAPFWGDDIVQSNRKRLAVQKAMEGKYTKKENGCWEWIGGKSHGYGTLRIHDLFGRTPVYAHRLAYLLAYGPIPQGLFVCHKCDNEPCINPDHLFLGTQKDNLQDMAIKGRSCIGMKNGRAKVTDKDVEQIRLLVQGGIRQYRVAHKFGLSDAQISRIVRGRRRGNLKINIRKRHGNYKHGLYCAA